MPNMKDWAIYCSGHRLDAIRTSTLPQDIKDRLVIACIGELSNLIAGLDWYGQ